MTDMMCSVAYEPSVSDCLWLKEISFSLKVFIKVIICIQSQHADMSYLTLQTTRGQNINRKLGCQPGSTFVSGTELDRILTSDTIKDVSVSLVLLLLTWSLDLPC